MKTIDPIDQMRPETPELEPEWSASTLRSILATPQRKPSRRWLPRLALGAAGLMVATSGVAYATDNVPAFIADNFDWVSPSKIQDMDKVASFSLEAAGSTRDFDIFRARNADGEVCTMIQAKVDGVLNEQGDGDVTCGEEEHLDGWFEFTPESGLIDEPMPNSTLYVWGTRTSSKVTAVRAFGEGFSHTVPIEKKTGGFATAIPEVILPDHGEVAGRTIATLEFLDADGNVVGTKPLMER